MEQTEMDFKEKIRLSNLMTWLSQVDIVMEGDENLYVLKEDYENLKKLTQNLIMSVHMVIVKTKFENEEHL